MFADMGTKIHLGGALKPVVFYLKRPFRLFGDYDRANLRPDLIAGVTVAVILLPQAIAFALIAELPPQMGLYAAVVGAIVGALWGSSNQIHNGPTNAISLLVLSALINATTPGSAEFFIAAGLMAVMVGVFQLIMGLARLGLVVNFVSHSVIVGFASGAGILIAIKQIKPFLGVSFSSHSISETISGIIANLPHAHLPTVGLGVGTILFIIALRKINPKIPSALASMIVASTAVFLLQLDQQGVSVIGQLPRSLPPLTDLSSFNWELIVRLSTGALAVGAIGLVETTAIARSVAVQTGQRLDSNQEFVGQGLGNIFSGLFSGYPTAGSFSRTAVNFKAGAKSPMSAIFSSIFVLIAMFTLGPLAAYLPVAALAGVLIVTAYGMIDRAEIVRIWRGVPGDAAIMVVTLVATLLLHIEDAVLLGIILSLIIYIVRTSTPRVHAVLPDARFRHLTYQSGRPLCPQLGIVDILGDLYFGAVNHIEETIFAQAERNPEQRFLLIRMSRVNLCDFSGIHMLESVAHAYRDRGGDLFLMRVSYAVAQLMQSTGFDAFLGSDHFLDEDEAITHLFYRVLDPVICIYECPLRAFKECQNLPKRIELTGIPHGHDIPEESVFAIAPQELWRQMHPETAVRETAVPPPTVIDVREPREFKRGHIPHARSIPLSTILSDTVKLPNDRQIVLTCRTGRRSRRAAYALQQMGVMNVAILEGGLLAWEASGLLEAVS
ncbi:MAG: sulfate permease [Chloroflexi bacterium]|nr:sulfate permease [Chloroflexota bacterium]